MNIKASLDNITSILMDPSNNNPVILNNKLAWVTTIILGICTIGIAQALSALWRKLRHIEQNDTHEKIGRIFSNLFGRNQSTNPAQPALSHNQAPLTPPAAPAPVAAISSVTPTLAILPKLCGKIIPLGNAIDADTVKQILTEQLRACGIDLITDNTHLHDSVPHIQFAARTLTSRPLAHLEDSDQQLKQVHNFDGGIFILAALKSQVELFFSDDENNAHKALGHYNDRESFFRQMVIAPISYESSSWNLSITEELIPKIQKTYEEVKNDPASLRIFVAQLIEDSTRLRLGLVSNKRRIGDVLGTWGESDESDSE